MRRRHFVLGLLAVPLTVSAAAAQESNFGAGRPEDRYFSVEASVGTGGRGPLAEGYVFNRYEYHATRVVLTLVPADAAGRPLPPVTVYVPDVPARGRSFFRAKLPAGASTVRAGVASFDWAPRGNSGGG
jgi:hypothetical protein